MHLKMCRNREKDIFVVTAANQYEPLTELRNTIVNRIQNSINSFIPEFVELRQNDIQNRSEFLLRIRLVTFCTRYMLQRCRHDPLTFSMMKNAGGYN